MSNSIFLKTELSIKKCFQQEILLPIFVKRQLKTYFLLYTSKLNSKNCFAEKQMLKPKKTKKKKKKGVIAVNNRSVTGPPFKFKFQALFGLYLINM